MSDYSECSTVVLRLELGRGFLMNAAKPLDPGLVVIMKAMSDELIRRVEE